MVLFDAFFLLPLVGDSINDRGQYALFAAALQ